MADISHGSYEYDLATLPAASVTALLQRGLNHVMGNEASSKVVSELDKMFAKHYDGKDGRADWSKVDKAGRKTAFTNFRDTQADDYSRLVATAQAAFHTAILNGELGVSQRGPSIDPLQRQMEVIAREEITSLLTQKKIKVPKKDATVTINGVAKTMADMIATRLAHTDGTDAAGRPTMWNKVPRPEGHGPAIRALAQKVLDERAARKLDAQATAAEADVADLGI